jgi:replication fork clamp-binding protein CrfC
VTVGEHYRCYVVAVFFEELEIGNAHVNTVSSLLGKTHTGVEDEHLVPITHSHAIHPKFADTAERDNL